MTIIETERLILRTWRKEDIALFAEMNIDPKVMKYYPSMLTPEQTKEFVARIQANFDKHGWGLWAVELKETGEFIGYVGLHEPAWYAECKPFKILGTPCAEIGWRLASAYWGKGYATEAAQAVLAYAFDILKLKEVVSFTVPENKASIRVMEKIGMHRDAAGDFAHPRVPAGSRFSVHVLYRIQQL